jgi:hypothetical protein
MGNDEDAGISTIPTEDKENENCSFLLSIY